MPEPATSIRDRFPVYSGDDLGATYSVQQTIFKLWSPGALAAQVLIFADPVGGYPIEVLHMETGDYGTWTYEWPGDHDGVFYTYRVKLASDWSLDVPDPYAKAVVVNGLRAMVINLQETNPDGWEHDKSPDFSPGNRPEDAVIYELHVRDASADASAGIRHKAKFLGLTETNTRNASGFSTGLDYLSELGITHLHLLPINDFDTVDETTYDPEKYNWGYDPYNYFVPEGSYAANPLDGKSRIMDCKKMVMALHQKGIRVVLDVVFNHTSQIRKSIFNQLVPGYYYRLNPDGSFSDGSGCGTETATEHPMMRKFMLDCLKYWLTEYHADGFRFDLMGLHDVETMQMIADELKAIKPDVLLYGEGWAGGHSVLPADQRAVKDNVDKLHGISVFSDDIRDALKGRVFFPNQPGFVGGATHLEETIKAGIVASCPHPQVNYTDSNLPGRPFAQSPVQVINYADCHDNHCLWDKLALSNATEDEPTRKKRQLLALSIILTSQGIPFLHAGSEFMRTKKGVENSYKSPDSINAINWDLRSTHDDAVTQIKTLIRLRRTHQGFRLKTGSQVAELIRFDEEKIPGFISYTIQSGKAGDSWRKIWVGINANTEAVDAKIPDGCWTKAFPEEHSISSIRNSYNVSPLQLVILYLDS